MEIVKQQIFLSNRERLDILELRVQRRLKFFSYTYRVTDRNGTNRPILRLDNYDGQIHYDSYDVNQRVFTKKRCPYKSPRELLQIIKIFRQNVGQIELEQL
ncbi:hypothetical protein [[Eubacterium] cellulosolvens]